MIWPPDEVFRRTPYPYCQILESPGNKHYPFSLVVTYADDVWKIEPMTSLDEACERAEHWQRVWRSADIEDRPRWLIVSMARAEMH